MLEGKTILGWNLDFLFVICIVWTGYIILLYINVVLLKRGMTIISLHMG